MKKKLLLLSNVILLSSCNVFVNNNLPNEKKTIVGDFGNIVKDKVTITDENGHDFSNQKLMVKGTLNDTVDHLIIGDEVEIYYKDETKTEIDHVFVIPAKVICFNFFRYYSEDEFFAIYQDYYVDLGDTKYISNEDLSYQPMNVVETGVGIYGSSQKIDRRKSYIQILALYTYCPR